MLLDRRINMPLRRMGANHAERALCVLQRSRRFGIRPRIRHPVFQQHAGDVDGIEPVAHLRAFEINGENAVSASGKNYHRRARAGRLCRVERERRCRNVADTIHKAAGHHVVFGRGGIHLGGRIGLSAVRAVRPQLQSEMARRRWPCLLLGQQ